MAMASKKARIPAMAEFAPSFPESCLKQNVFVPRLQNFRLFKNIYMALRDSAIWKMIRAMTAAIKLINRLLV